MSYSDYMIERDEARAQVRLLRYAIRNVRDNIEAAPDVRYTIEQYKWQCAEATSVLQDALDATEPKP